MDSLSKDLKKIFDEAYEKDPVFKDFVDGFGKNIVAPAIELNKEGKEEECRKLLTQGFAIASASINPGFAAELLKSTDKR